MLSFVSGQRDGRRSVVVASGRNLALPERLHSAQRIQTWALYLRIGKSMARHRANEAQGPIKSHESQPLVSRSQTLPLDDRKFMDRADSLRNLTLKSRSSLAMELPELHELIVSEDKQDPEPASPGFLIVPAVKELPAPDESIWLVAPKWFRVAKLWFQGAPPCCLLGGKNGATFTCECLFIHHCISLL